MKVPVCSRNVVFSHKRLSGTVHLKLELGLLVPRFMVTSFAFVTVPGELRVALATLRKTYFLKQVC